jgi:hypothetical protein
MFSALNQRLRAWAEKDGRGYPDWAMRYLPVVRRLRHRDLQRERILEIGANENGFSRFAGVPVIAIDINPEHLKASRAVQHVIPVVADITALPFKDSTFDVSVCMDTFEHLPEETRYQAADEILRILNAEGSAVIGFPSGQASFAAEERIRKAYNDLTGDVIPFLEEHCEQGLPDGNAIFEHFKNYAADGYRVSRRENSNLRIWVWTWKVLMCNWPGRANGLFQAFLRLLTPLFSQIHTGACYRSMIWIESKRGNSAPK